MVLVLATAFQGVGGGVGASHFEAGGGVVVMLLVTSFVFAFCLSVVSGVPFASVVVDGFAGVPGSINAPCMTF